MKPNCLVRVLSVLILTTAALTAQVAQPGNVIPLKNWATPLYWQPNQAEKRAASAIRPELQFSPNQVSTDALTFVAITPCRLVDTRGLTAGFNGIAPFSGPSIPAGGTLTIPVQSATEASTNTTPAPCGVIPSIAQAYSFNLTVVPGGPIGFISIWPAGSPQPVVSTLNDLQAQIVSNAVIVPAGTPNGGVSVFNVGPSAADVILDMNGFFAAPTDLNNNTAVGTGTLTSSIGGYNTAAGVDALQSNTVGIGNTAIGNSALRSNTTGLNNVASGNGALQFNTSGDVNTATGAGALYMNTTGYGNTATGGDALTQNTAGLYNTAIGVETLGNNTTGSYNIAVGFNAANNVSGGNGNNIHIGSLGSSADSGVIKIGTVGTQTSAYVAGIYGATPGTPNLLVCLDANGQLGTSGCSSTPSSALFKEQQLQDQVRLQQEENRRLEDRLAALEAMLLSLTSTKSANSQ